MSNNRSKQPELVYRPATRTEQITDLLRVAGMLLGTTATATAAAVTTAVLAAFYFLPDLLLVPEGIAKRQPGRLIGWVNQPRPSGGDRRWIGGRHCSGRDRPQGYGPVLPSSGPRPAGETVLDWQISMSASLRTASSQGGNDVRRR